MAQFIKPLKDLGKLIAFALVVHFANIMGSVIVQFLASMFMLAVIGPR